ncbi:MASE1 domain-containing protein [Enterobacter asburiae]|uniref:MASE1 domain-containing protein n=1 Tax=Scandinavium sp. UTDF21-P1B TaxID=3446379 RepID=UPI00348CDA45
MVRFTLRWLVFCLCWSGLALLSLQYRDPWSFSTTTWLPACILFATLLLTSIKQWPLWVISAMLMHTLCGFYIGRPLPLAALFAFFDGLSVPLCALALILLDRIWTERETSRPLLFSLSEVATLSAITFSMGALLTLCLRLNRYDVASFHLVSWSLALLTGCLAFWPLTWSLKKCALTPWRQRWRRDVTLLLVNITLMLLLFGQVVNGPKAMLSGFNPVYLLLSSLLLSSLLLSGRALGLLLVAHYVVAIRATLMGLGPFARLQDTAIWGIWDVQWYVAFASLLAFTLFRFAESDRLQQEIQHSQQRLETALSDAASHITFRIILPQKRLAWSAPSRHFFANGYSIATLALLEASSEPPFNEQFEQWYQGDQKELFLQQLMVFKGEERVPCLLVIAPELPDKTMLGGLSVLAK